VSHDLADISSFFCDRCDQLTVVGAISMPCDGQHPINFEHVFNYFPGLGVAGVS
jgi:hypothetical protein